MLQQKDDALYAAMQARDARFDGRFFVGISSTGIYCRPVCKAKRAKKENCHFYETAAEAEQAGYRPCLICRPELAPGLSITDASASLARRAARMIEQDCSGEQNVDELAKRLGCSSRHLRRVFAEEFNVSPIQYLQTCRLLLAKNLLASTNLSVLDVAMASGFNSLRRFNDLFRQRYRLSPTALRKQLPGKVKQESITLALGYRPPYNWEQMLGFLEGRAISGVEMVKDGEYYRAVRIAHAQEKFVSGWVRVGHEPDKNALSVTISETLLPVLPQVLARVRNLFDLYCDPETVFAALKTMNDFRPGLCRPGTRLPGCFDSFEMAVRAILGQQITLKAASTLAKRLVEAHGAPVETGIEGLEFVFPTAKDIIALGETIEDQLGSLGVASPRSRAILALATAIECGQIDLSSGAQPEEEIKKLMTIKGIGNWTAQYIAMRAMSWTDSFLETDVGIKKALAPHSPKELLEISQVWRPWRSYATINIWLS